jgi:signal transduction histidine kinase
MFTNAFYAVQQRQRQGEAGYAPEVCVTTRQLPDEVEIRVRDNGTGMPESVQAKIFQPFFTTKPTGEGTGLGLSLSHDIIDEEADRLNRMVGDLLDYSRPVQPSLEPVPIKPLLEQAITAACQQAGPDPERVVTAIRVDEDAVTVRADERLLRQALLNLFLNAYQAMPQEGRLEVRASRGVIDGRPCAEIVVRDTGPGIPTEMVGKIFQPFFTTKPTGTGLGLAVVRRIVEGHGGTIELGSPPGAEFTVRLPLEGQSG